MSKLFPLRDIRVNGNEFTCRFHANIEFVNSVRRSIISDTMSYAPSKVDIEVNTTCQTNEYIAHRIGMIPFCQKNLNKDVILTLHVRDRDATTSDFVGPTTACETVDIMRIIPGQELKLRVHFEQNCGATHSRWCPIAACSHFLNDDNTVQFKFEVINDMCPLHIMKDAFLNLHTKLRDFESQIGCTS